MKDSIVITRTPYRMSFLGGGTDHKNWFNYHGGCVLSATIDKYCYLLVKKLENFFDIKYKVIYRKIENTNSLDEIEHSTARECLRFLNIDNGIEIHHTGDLPARSGVASSSAYAVGLLNALYALNGIYTPKDVLAKEAIHIERNMLKELGGNQDQIACAFGGFNKISFYNDNKFIVEPIPISSDRLKLFNDHLLLFYLKSQRSSFDIAESFVPNIDSKRRQMRISKDLVDEGINILCSNSDITYFGELLHEYWMIKSSLSDKVSTNTIDEYYNLTRENGAIGGKILGAGGGGFLLIFAEPPLHEKIINSFKNAVHVKFEFERSGSTIIFKG
jgi:D-glycero-alpha-D-manno-heptose-7-phosphate kinase